MPSSDEYCPVAKSVEILGDRWCLLLVREMLRGVDRFNELQRSVPGISRSILTQRLRHLEREGIVRRRVEVDGRSTDYRLTDAGRELGGVVGALNDWGTRWRIPDGAADGQSADVDPDGLMRWIRRHVVLVQLPDRQIVVAFELRGAQRRLYWLVLRQGEVSLCPDHPGFVEDVRVTSTPSALYRVFLGRQSIGSAVRHGLVRLDGPATLVRALPGWFRLDAGKRAVAAR
jgi:DNA-binding HxlR family transcriptional regulator